MTMRAVNPYQSYQVLLDLQRTKARMAELSEQISSGSRLTSLGNDPTASALVLDFQSSIDKNMAYIDQATSATATLNTTETSLSALNDEITQLLENCVTGLGDSTTASERTLIAAEVDGSWTVILSSANTQTGGKYIFAGTQTTTQPFSESTSGSITYSGDGNSIALDVSSSTSVSTNLSGATVFFGSSGQGSATDLFQQVTDLRDGLASNNVSQIQTAYDNLKTILGNINSLITEVGVRQASLQQITENTKNYNLALQTIQSSYQDLDYSAASIEYTQAEISQEAALSVLAKENVNLFDYLG